MKTYWIEDECGVTKVEKRIYISKRSQSLKFMGVGSKTFTRTITDHGNGWRIQDSHGTEAVLCYSTITDIIAAFTIWQGAGERIWHGRIYGEGVAIIKPAREKKK